jgi:ABC-type multidrug transport system fused ATPase/permease subunit
MSNLEHDEDLAQQKLFNIDVIKLLFRYVFRYRRYLYYSLVFVAFTTATTLYVPVLTRDIIDKYVVNAGYTVKKNVKTDSPDQKLFNRIIDKQSIVLDTQQLFIYQGVLKNFSRKFIDSLRENGNLSKKKYTLIRLDPISKELRIKIDHEALAGNVLVVNSYLLIPQGGTQIFTIKEMSELRASDMRKVFADTCTYETFSNGHERSSD